MSTKKPAPAKSQLAGATADGKSLTVDGSMEGLPSVAFDAVFVLGGAKSVQALSSDGVALHYLLEAYKHLKAIALHGEGEDGIYTDRVPP